MKRINKILESLQRVNESKETALIHSTLINSANEIIKSGKLKATDNYSFSIYSRILPKTLKPNNKYVSFSRNKGYNHPVNSFGEEFGLSVFFLTSREKLIRKGYTCIPVVEDGDLHLPKLVAEEVVIGDVKLDALSSLIIPDEQSIEVLANKYNNEFIEFGMGDEISVDDLYLISDQISQNTKIRVIRVPYPEFTVGSGGKVSKANYAIFNHPEVKRFLK